MTASEFLDAVDNTTSAATDGPWEANPEWVSDDGTEYRPPSVTVDGWSGYPVNDATTAHLPMTDADAHLMAQSRSWVPAMSAALKEVLELHKPIESPFSGATVCEACSWLEVGVETEHPCRAVEAIEKHLNDSGRQ